MSVSTTREPSFGRAFFFSKALATASETVAEISIRRSPCRRGSGARKPRRPDAGPRVRHRGAPSSSREPAPSVRTAFGFSLLTLGSDFGECLLECLLLSAQLGDPLGDQLGLDSLLRPRRRRKPPANPGSSRPGEMQPRRRLAGEHWSGWPPKTAVAAEARLADRNRHARPLGDVLQRNRENHEEAEPSDIGCIRRADRKRRSGGVLRRRCRRRTSSLCGRFTERG
jgi:hypothetical protein